MSIPPEELQAQIDALAARLLVLEDRAAASDAREAAMRMIAQETATRTPPPPPVSG
jgi:hypothetical protein